MTPIDDVIGDLDDAIENFTRALGGTDAQRRTLRVALACIYELRVHREGTGEERTAYHLRAEKTKNGLITEGLVFLRGKATHFVTKVLDPAKQPLLPRGKTLPGKHTFVGSNVVWRPCADLGPLTGTSPKETKRLQLY